MQKIMQLMFTDVKLIFRDSSLKSFFFLPVLLYVLMIWVVPILAQKYEVLEPYLPLILVAAVIENTQMFSFISSMVLIDEKEANVAKIYGVVPLSKVEYLLSRFLFPYLFTVLLNFVMIMAQPIFEVGLMANLSISMLAGLVVPVYALSINTIVKNRMQGMVWIKAFNMLVLVPIAAFFVPEQFKHLFGFLPTHWLFQSVVQSTNGAFPALWLGIGFLFLCVVGWLVSKVFLKRHFE